MGSRPSALLSWAVGLAVVSHGIYPWAADASKLLKSSFSRWATIAYSGPTHLAVSASDKAFGSVGVIKLSISCLPGLRRRSMMIFKSIAMMKMKFKNSMLEYSKFILSKMTFDRKLFRKEFRKAFRYLNREECRQLIRWVRSQA